MASRDGAPIRLVERCHTHPGTRNARGQADLAAAGHRPRRGGPPVHGPECHRVGGAALRCRGPRHSSSGGCFDWRRGGRATLVSISHSAGMAVASTWLALWIGGWWYPPRPGMIARAVRWAGTGSRFAWSIHTTPRRSCEALLDCDDRAPTPIPSGRRDGVDRGRGPGALDDQVVPAVLLGPQ